MSGGSALAVQDLEGAHRKGSNHVTALVTAMSFGDVKTHNDAKQFLKTRGCSDEEAGKIIGGLVEQKHIFKGVFDMDAELKKSFDDAADELAKALGDKAPPKAPAEGGYKPEGEPDAGGGGGGETEEEKKARELAAAAAAGGDVSKSIQDQVKAGAGEFLDVAPFLQVFTKAVGDAFGALDKKIETRLTAIETMQKSIGRATLTQGEMLKSLGDAPAPRQAVLEKQARTFQGPDGKPQTLTNRQILQKAMVAVEARKLAPVDFAKIEDRLNKSLPINDELLQLITG